MSQVPSTQSEAKPSVLIIDDSKDVHRLVSVRLRPEGIDFSHAYGGVEGLQMARTMLPALILLDMEMPDIRGLEVLRQLKDDAATQDIPVIIISGNQQVDDKVRSFELGAVDYVTKPFEMTELRIRIRQALNTRQLIQMLAQRAQLDGLTGLWNRAFFNQRWKEEFDRSTRHGHSLSVAMVDIDHFKSINDTYGHTTGDAVLQTVAKIIQRCCRTHDLVCRYGGEEFVIVMPDTSPADAVTVCERIRATIEAERWPRHPQRTVTASIGVGGLANQIGQSADAIIETADANLYEAKRAGRNRVVAAPASEASGAAA
jgi:two-component system, cell cycle response regulator